MTNDKNATMIHDASMEILSRTGMMLHHEGVLDYARKHGFRVDGHTVFFDETKLMDLIHKGPASFTLHAADPACERTLGNGSLLFAPGYGAPNVIDPDGNSRSANMQDYIDFLKLCEASPAFDCNGGILVHPAEIDQSQAALIMLSAILEHSRKCLILPSAHKQELEYMERALSFWFGEKFTQSPHVTGIINTLTPLQIDENAIENILFYARNNQPAMISPCSMAGTTGPVTLAGNFALSNAETLGGLAVIQMVNPGCPMIYGMQSTASDMATGGISMGNPERAITVHLAAQQAAFYSLPFRTGGSDTDAQGHNAQAGAEGMFTLSASVQAKTDIIVHAAGILAGFAAMSFEKFIMDQEFVLMHKKCAEELVIDKETLALDLIHKAGPGGEFLTSAHTMKHCRTALFHSRTGVRRSINNTIDAHKELMEKNAREKTRLLEACPAPAADKEKLSRVRELLTPAW